MNKQVIITILLVASLFAVVPASVSADRWVSPGDDIQDAVDDAIANGGTVYFAPGDYNNVNIRINAPSESFALRGSGPSTTTLDGGAAGSVIVIKNTGSSIVTVEGFTITNGSGETISDSSYGGGMCIHYANAYIADCTFSRNTADYGGGMYNAGFSPTVSNCTFTGNDAEYFGAGMYNDNSSPTVTNCTFSRNTADYGGGMDNDYSSPTVTNCTFTCNDAEYGGGIDFWMSPDSEITNCTFSRNTADYGGAMYNYDFSTAVTDCTIFDNTSEDCGNADAKRYRGAVSQMAENREITDNGIPNEEGILSSDLSMSITNCTFTDNHAEDYGGGMYNAGSSPTVSNCTFTFNDAEDYGGGMDNDYSSPTVTNCTFTGNTADYGGAMYNEDSSTAVTNCIMWEDAASEGAEIYSDTSESEVRYSDIQGGYPGLGNIDADPCFAGAASKDLRLRNNSPCIDSGTDTSGAEYGFVTDDIEGTPRPQFDAYDMGAYEYDLMPWSPALLQPLVATSLGQANSLWSMIGPDIAGCENECILDMAAQVQECMLLATTLANPVAACGALSQAIAIMEDVIEMLTSDTP